MQLFWPVWVQFSQRQLTSGWHSHVASRHWKHLDSEIQNKNKQFGQDWQVKLKQLEVQGKQRDAQTLKVGGPEQLLQTRSQFDRSHFGCWHRDRSSFQWQGRTGRKHLSIHSCKKCRQYNLFQAIWPAACFPSPEQYRIAFLQAPQVSSFTKQLGFGGWKYIESISGRPICPLSLGDCPNAKPHREPKIHCGRLCDYFWPETSEKLASQHLSLPQRCLEKEAAQGWVLVGRARGQLRLFGCWTWDAESMMIGSIRILKCSLRQCGSKHQTESCAQISLYRRIRSKICPESQLCKHIWCPKKFDPR